MSAAQKTIRNFLGHYGIFAETSFEKTLSIPLESTAVVT
jgi:hypothetical protein